MSRACLVVLLLVLTGCATGPEVPAPPRGAIAIGLIGDTPYSLAQATQLDGVIDAMNLAPLAVVVHVGDITSGCGPCGDAWLLARKRQLERIRHPFVLLPGDNEWTDCHRGGFEPLERLARWRQLFCTDVALPAFVRQPALQPQFGAYCEHARWEAGNAVFVALNVTGSNNNLGRSAAMDAERAARMRAVRAWLDAALARAARPAARLLVVLMHANPGFSGTHPPGRFDGLDKVRDMLAETVRRLRKPVLLVHGDSHSYRDDKPLAGLRRIEVWGAPDVRWVAATLYPDGSIEVRD